MANRTYLLPGALSSLLIACGGANAPQVEAQVAAPVEADFNDAEAYAKAQGLELRRFDLNRDKRPDVFKYYRAGSDAKAQGEAAPVLVRKDVDLNNDGKVDVVRMYDDKGDIVEERTDLDFDGRFDDVTIYAAGVLARKEIDLDYDGKPDVKRFYVEGKLGHVEADRNGDGKVDTWEYYEGGALDRVGTDADGDGIVDKWERTKRGEAAASEPGEAQPSSESSSEATPASSGS